MLKVSDIASRTGQLTDVPPHNLLPLPAPYDRVEDLPARKELKPEVLDRIDTSLDGFSALGLVPPADTGRRADSSSSAFCPVLRSC